MKKLLAILIALVLCLSFAAIAEEEAALPEVTSEVTFDAQTVALGDTGLTIQIPADWAVQEAPEGILLYALMPDGSVAVTVQTADMDFDTLLSALDEAGATADMVNELYINGIYCLAYEASETAASFYTWLDEATLLTVGFTATTAEASNSVGDLPAQIFGSLAAA